MRWMGMNEQRACLRIEILLFLSIFVLFFVSRRSSDGSGVCCDKRSAREAHASWCVYNYAVIKLIYDEKTRDRVADNFYHLNGYSSSESTMNRLKQFKLLATRILISLSDTALDVQISKQLH